MSGAFRYVVIPLGPLESADVIGKPVAPPPGDMTPRVIDRREIKQRRKKAARARRKR